MCLISDTSHWFIPVGVRVFFDNHQSVYVAVPDHFEERMCGLCGNYDGISENDFRVDNQKVCQIEIAIFEFNLRF